MTRRIERYLVHERIAEGGMASVHVGTLRGEGGFKKAVAIKEMQPHLAREAEFREMFLDEARTVSRIRHANVVATLDVVAKDDQLFLVMEYVHGPTLAHVLKSVQAEGGVVPLNVAVRILADVLAGLHAAHEAADERGQPLGIVHRDVSPHNVLLADDGRALVMDFGIATAADRSHVTKTGEIKGKASYMAPEQARAERVDRRADVYAAGVVAFELLTLRRPFGSGSMAEVLARSLFEPAPPVEIFRADAPPALDAAIAVALSKSPAERFPTARDFSDALTSAVVPASHDEVAEWLEPFASELLASRDTIVERALAQDDEPDEPAPIALPPAAPAKNSRPTSRAGVLGATLSVAALVTLAIFVRSRFREAQPEVATSAPSMLVSPPPSPSPSTFASPSATIASAASQAAIPTALAVPLRTTARSAVPVLPPSVASTSVPSTTATPSSAPRRPCCLKIGDTFQRYSFGDCTDNCPPGTP